MEPAKNGYKHLLTVTPGVVPGLCGAKSTCLLLLDLLVGVLLKRGLLALGAISAGSESPGRAKVPESELPGRTDIPDSEREEVPGSELPGRADIADSELLGRTDVPGSEREEVAGSEVLGRADVADSELLGRANVAGSELPCTADIAGSEAERREILALAAKPPVTRTRYAAHSENF